MITVVIFRFEFYINSTKHWYVCYVTAWFQQRYRVATTITTTKRTKTAI